MLNEKKMYVLQLSNGNFYCGYKCFDKQLRKAKIYHSLKYINDVAEEYKHLKPKVLEVTLSIVSTVDQACGCYSEEFGKSYCLGTKECDPCSCGGDKDLCDFYPR